MIAEVIKFVPTFWGKILEWIVPLMTGPFPRATWLGVAVPVIVVIVYLIVCLVAAKLLDRIIGAINNHMADHNFYVTYNFRLYFLALVCMVLEAFDVFAAGGVATGSRGADGRLNIGFFALIAMGIILIALIRMLFRAKFRIVYYFPLQVLVWVLFYLYLLVLIPAALMAGLGVAAETSGGGKEEKCKRCGKPCSSCTCDFHETN